MMTQKFVDMFGNKLRSWMEAVRPRKKQHRKEKQLSTNIDISPSKKKSKNNVVDTKKIVNGLGKNTQTGKNSAVSRYSANNLSSPESAYSTGYSTDGTSPGAPPDCYINIKAGVKYDDPKTANSHDFHKQNKATIKQQVCTTSPCSAGNVTVHCRPTNNLLTQEAEIATRTSVFPNCVPTTNRLTEVVIPSPSPRQRNRIRTNPWLPGNTLSPCQVRQETPKVIHHSKPITDNHKQRCFLSPSTALKQIVSNQSLSSSSCSSLSGLSVHWDLRKPASDSEDDCTLNEMMGKYDESYIYEKETDILSDSEPTDCDTDIDTGQDGGDEDDPLEAEFDYIDNGSFLELDPKDERNTGHCIYYNFDVQRKTSRRRTTRRNKQSSEKRKRSSSNKKRHKQSEYKVNALFNGSKSAGATPLSVRRTKHQPISKLALENCLKKRSNSVSFSRDPLDKIDKRDKEADRKYKELIVEADHILRNMKINGLSPRRIPGPANKRVEILRNTECAKPELFIKNRFIEEGTQFPKIPSNNFSCSRFSPKRNHITNFINSNSPVLVRKELELPKSPLIGIKKSEMPHTFKNKERRSPKYQKRNNQIKFHHVSSTSSDSEVEIENTISKNNYFSFGCPQSEPVKRKVYFSNTKTVAFNLNNKNICNNNSPPYSPSRFDSHEYKNSVENLRQQVLLNTIVNLKRSLEDQSASLKQVYKSSQNINL